MIEHRQSLTVGWLRAVYSPCFFLEGMATQVPGPGTLPSPSFVPYVSSQAVWELAVVRLVLLYCGMHCALNEHVPTENNMNYLGG